MHAALAGSHTNAIGPPFGCLDPTLVELPAPELVDILQHEYIYDLSAASHISKSSVLRHFM